MTLAIRVLGVGDAFTTKYHHASFVVEGGDTRLLVDAPPALARALHDLGDRGGERVGLGDVSDVVITHLHGDHVGGLEQLLFWRRFVTGKKVRVHGIADVLGDLWEGRLRAGMEWLLEAAGTRRRMGLEDYADVSPLLPGKNRIGALEVEWKRTIHHIPTSALRVSIAGRTFGYSADTSFDPELIAWLGDSHLFFHETNHGIHTPLEKLVSLESTLRARMRLIHYPDSHDVERSPIACAREGDRFEP